MQFNIFHFAYKKVMHFGMFQAGGELSRQTGSEVLMQIDKFIFRPEECRGLKLILCNIWWLSGGSKCTESYGIVNCLLHGYTNYARYVTFGGIDVNSSLFTSY